MEQIYRMALGTDLESATIPAYQIAGIVIDNPSGSWLRVSGVEKYVPPYTNQWSYPCSPKLASVSVRFVDSPSGSQSVLVGLPPIVTLYNVGVPAYAGTPSGAGARVATTPLYESAFFVLFVNTTVSYTVLTPPVGENWIIRRLALSRTFLDAPATPLLIAVTAFWEVVPPPAAPYQPFSWYQSITPENMYITDQFEDGAAIVMSGSTLQVSAFDEVASSGGGEPPYVVGENVTVECQFYREVVR